MVDSVSPSPKALVCCPSRLIRQFRRVLLGSPYARSWIFEAELYSSTRTPSHTSNLRIHLTYAQSEALPTELRPPGARKILPGKGLWQNAEEGRDTQSGILLEAPPRALKPLRSNPSRGDLTGG